MGFIRIIGYFFFFCTFLLESSNGQNLAPSNFPPSNLAPSSFAPSNIAPSSFAPSNSLFSAVLVFGGSSVDTGNNNYIPYASFKSDYLPYGLDYDYETPTGRFSNGKVIPDFVSSRLGLKDRIPPFLDPKLPDEELSSGVNFASAGAGFDDLTLSTRNAICITSQVALFKRYIERLKIVVGGDNANLILNNSLVMATTGSFDNVNVYLVGPKKSLDAMFNYKDHSLITNIKQFIKQMYGLGCPTILVTGLPPFGCLPLPNKEISAECTDEQNKDSLYYNDQLIEMLPKLQDQLPGSKLIYVDVYKPIVDMINFPAKYGFVETRSPCCTTTLLMCQKDAPICQNTSEYLYWDRTHLTEAGNRHLMQIIEKDILPKILTKN
ncbi:GDSL esterase/lipase At2g30220-like [Mercurialis annua]|uniref:GDSL esterase/lipase At2g30220-like n=1 Tax=Mercurialis annua TaxID=3986 RepID=UPI00215DEBDD|nr:GDSL esterase/lipase At2g30220-like [Mercurialis annua]